MPYLSTSYLFLAISRKFPCQHRVNRVKYWIVLDIPCWPCHALPNVSCQPCRVTVPCWPCQKEFVRRVSCVSLQRRVSRVSLWRRLRTQNHDATLVLRRALPEKRFQPCQPCQPSKPCRLSRVNNVSRVGHIGSAVSWMRVCPSCRALILSPVLGRVVCYGGLPE